MHIEDFRYIVTIAELKSFTNAANQLFIAQPSLSQRVKHIEKKYDITIFIRDSKGVRLTEEGEMFVGYARQILSLEEELQDRIDEMHDTTNRPIILGAPPQQLNAPYFRRILRQFTEQTGSHLQLVDASSVELQDQLLENKIQLAFCRLPIKSSELRYDIIYDDRFVLVPAKGGSLERKLQEQGYKHQDEIDATLLSGESFSVGTSGSRNYQLIEALNKRHNVNVNILHYCKDFTMLYNLAKDGISSVFITEAMFDPDIQDQPYYYLKNIEESELKIAIVRKKGVFLSKGARELIQIARGLYEQQHAVNPNVIG